MRAIGLAIVAVAVILTVGRFVVTPLMRLAAATGSRELVIAIALFLAIGTGLMTEMAGLSAALGAFLAGMLLGECEFRHQIEVEIEPFKGLLLGLFFMTVGMSFDLASLQLRPAAADRGGGGAARLQGDRHLRRDAAVRRRAGGGGRGGLRAGRGRRIRLRRLHAGAAGAAC